MSLLPEDPRERAQFDRETTELFGGNALARVAQALTIWSQMAPPHGSYGKQCAIMANIVAQAAGPNQAEAPGHNGGSEQDG